MSIPLGCPIWLARSRRRRNKQSERPGFTPSWNTHCPETSLRTAALANADERHCGWLCRWLRTTSRTSYAIRFKYEQILQADARMMLYDRAHALHKLSRAERYGQVIVTAHLQKTSFVRQF